MPFQEIIQYAVQTSIG